MTLIYKILERRVATHTEVGPGIYGTCRVGKILLSTRQPAWSYWNLHNFSQVKKKKKSLLTEKENLWKPLCQTTPMTICPSAMWATSQPPLSPMISSELNFCFRRLPLSTSSSFLSVPARVLSTEFEFGQQDFLIRTLSPFFFFFLFPLLYVLLQRDWVQFIFNLTCSCSKQQGMTFKYKILCYVTSLLNCLHFKFRNCNRPNARITFLLLQSNREQSLVQFPHF